MDAIVIQVDEHFSMIDISKDWEREISVRSKMDSSG